MIRALDEWELKYYKWTISKGFKFLKWEISFDFQILNSQIHKEWAKRMDEAMKNVKTESTHHLPYWHNIK